MKLEHCNRLSCVQIIDALTKERDEARMVAATGSKYVSELAAAQAQVALLREPLPMKGHLFAQMVNDLRDCAIKYHDHQSLRERIAYTVGERIKAS